jgi:hypothetical protein
MLLRRRLLLLRLLLLLMGPNHAPARLNPSSPASLALLHLSLIIPVHPIPIPVTPQRFVTALVSETLRHKTALDQVLDRSHLRSRLKKDVRDPHLLYLLLYDLLYGKGISGGGQVKRLLLAHEPALRRAAEGVEPPPPQAPASQAGASDVGDGVGRFPRYARVNPLKTTVAAAIAALAVPGKGEGAAAAAAAAAVVASKEEVQVRVVV